METPNIFITMTTNEFVFIVATVSLYIIYNIICLQRFSIINCKHQTNKITSILVSSVQAQYENMYILVLFRAVTIIIYVWI